jgi:transcriptional regulator with XRE-family HTH domain
MTRLEQLRVAAALSVDELAEKSGVSRVTIYGIEARRVRRPRMATARALAAELGVPVADLLTESAAAA